MKRIYVCIGIVVLLLAAAFYSSFRVQQFAEDISDDIDTAMEDIERSSMVRYSLKCIEHVFDLMLKLMIKRDIRSCLSSSKMVR